MPKPRPLHITFLTGTRAEFGLMEPTLHAIQRHPKLQLSLLATGMHLDPAHGHSLTQIKRRGFKVNATIPWPPAKLGTRNKELGTIRLATSTGNAIAQIAPALTKLKTDVLLIVGDRVEALAGAVAAHLSHIPVAHVHGGDRALGQIDDSLRHAITKLAHLHFPATKQSAARIKKLGEDPWRIHTVGSPGLDGIRQLATSRSQLAKRYNVRANDYALLVLHPASPDEALEERRARIVLDAMLERFDHVVIIYPNNDPGSQGILKVWRELERANLHALTLLKDAPRPDFLGLMRDATLLAGNSSSGIIEAASFATPVLDIGDRQLGRQRSANVKHATYNPAALRRSLKTTHFRRVSVVNVYGSGRAGESIARVLSSMVDPGRHLKKLITF